MSQSREWPNAREERYREREFYRYFAPLRASSSPSTSGDGPVGLPYVDLFDEKAAKAHQPQSSPIATLTALCQLAAIRLEAKRALLFFFDRDSAYVLAEATQSLSLESDAKHEVNDGLWLGATVIPRGLAVCEHTINIPAANKGSNQFHADAGQIHIINDLMQDDRFCDRPYVTDGPKARFYAGVPLKTPSGRCIGAMCVLDDEPRDGLTARQTSLLINLSNAVIDHMDAVKARAESARGTHVLSTMTSFLTNPTVLNQELAIPDDEQANAVRQPVKQNLGVSTAESIDLPKAQTTAESGLASQELLRPSMPVRNRSSFQSRVQDIFAAAASSIRTASEADGVAFIDVEDRSNKATLQRGGSHIPRSTASAPDDESTENTDISARFGSHSNPANALASVLGQAIVPPTVKLETLTVQFLNTLLKRYPKGKIWYFERKNDSTSDSASDYASDSTRDEGESPGKASTGRQVRAMLRQVFPGVRALGMVNTVDYLKGQTYAMGFIWTFSPVRILSFEADLNLLQAFGDVIMGQVYRLKAQNENQVKSDFVSSVSHELRSPIHGILGNLDLLRETNSLDWAVVDQIERCSTDLLGVVEHLLEFSKITKPEGRSIRPRRHRKSLNRADPSTALGREHVQDLAKLLEEAAIMAHHARCRNLEDTYKPRLAFIVDIDTLDICETRLNRTSLTSICTNIMSNALKYTVTGQIVISLTSFDRPQGPVAVLQVADTGAGMSTDFVRHHLLHAFSQEDHLSQGTGLGLNIAAQLIKEIGGQLDIESSKDVGTTVKVVIPLASEPTPIPPSVPSGMSVKLQHYREDDTSRSLQIAAIRNNCRRIGIGWTNDRCDIWLVFEEDLSRLLSEIDLKHGSIVLLCATFASAAGLRLSGLTAMLGCHVEYISQPYGPDQLAKAFTTIYNANLPSDDTLSLVEPSTTDVAQLWSPRTSAPTSPPSTLIEYVNSYLQIVHQKLDKNNGEGSSDGEMLSTPLSPLKLDLASPMDDDISSAASSVLLSPALDEQPILLLVEDNPINLRLLVAYADKNRYTRHTATNGQEAVRIYKKLLQESAKFDFRLQNQTSPDIIVLMDINMPIMNGFEATKTIRTLEQEQDARRATIVAITALGSDEAREKATQAGVDRFVTKPVRMKDLKTLLQALEEPTANG